MPVYCLLAPDWNIYPKTIMKNIAMFLAITLTFAACSDNGSSDDSQTNTKTAPPTQDSMAHSHDSSTPSVENTGATNPNTVNSVGNQGSGATGKTMNTDSTVHADGVTNGSAVSHDTAAMSKGQRRH